MPLKSTSFAKVRVHKSLDLLIFQFKKIILIPELNFTERNLIVVGNYTLVTQRKIKSRPPFVWVGTEGHFNTCAIFLHPESSRSFLSTPTLYFSPLSLPVVATEISAWLGQQNIWFFTFLETVLKIRGSFSFHQKLNIFFRYFVINPHTS